MKASETLIKAKELITDPKNWTKEAFGRNEHGESTGSLDPDAVCWCSLGAVNKVRDSGDEPYCNYLFMAAANLTGESLFAYNDNRTHEEVMLMFDTAIELAKEAENGSQV